MKAVASVCGRAGLKVYLVGGVVRNLMLGCRAQPDYDFVILGGVARVAAAIARRLKGSAFILDKEAPSYRVVFRKGGRQVTIDLSPVKAFGVKADIVADLRGRDFTIDAMAVDLREIAAGGQVCVIDPCNGMEDAKAGLVAAVSERVFKDDPLRMLRAVRLAVQYGLTITDDTVRLIKADAGLLANVSVERIRAELVAILECKGASASVMALYDLGLIGAIIPQMKDWEDLAGYDILGHTLKALDAAELLLDNMDEESFGPYHARLKRHFARSVGGVKRSVWFMLAVLLHDIGKPAAMTIEAGRLRFYGHDHEGAAATAAALRRLKFSSRACAAISTLVRCHHRVFGLAGLVCPSARAKAHLLRSVGADLGLDLLCLALADAHATRGGQDPELSAVVREMFRFYYETYLKKPPGPVMNGAEVMKTFGVAEGPAVGKILAKIAEGVESGAVRTKKEAAAFVRKWLKAGTESG
ncbi:MAG: HD domain-containing protein [Deltaproteobacteria bacterium]|nr:HD domain-containing protein [Deltaproteobacteria bacterium]